MIAIAGAYPAAPRHHDVDSEEGRAAYVRADAAFTDALVEKVSMLGAGGLELAWHDGRLHPREDEHLAALPPTWQHLVTTIPDTMVTWRTEPTFGLASPDDAGRAAALDRLAALRDRLAELSAHRGGRSLAVAVLVHSAPRLGHDPAAGRRALTSSLQEAAAWDWGGAHLLVEHCDAGDRELPAKGFLPLDDELAALDDAAGLPTPVGLLVNWGRSVIERRDRRAALDHVVAAAAAGQLSGLMFSGVAAGGATEPWLDNHLPSNDVCDTSLLRPRDIAETVAAARAGGADLLVAGVKVTATAPSTDPVARATDVATVLGHVTAALEAQA